MSPIYLVLLVSLLASVALAVNRARQKRFVESPEGQKSALDNFERAKSMLREGEQLVVVDGMPNRRDFVFLTDRRIHYENNRGKVFEAEYQEIKKLKMVDLSGSKVKNPTRAAILTLKTASGAKSGLTYAFPQLARLCMEISRRVV